MDTNTNVLALALTLLLTPPGENFHGRLPVVGVSWNIQSNLCELAEFESRIATNGNFIIEARDNLTNGSAWYGLGQAITAPDSNRQTLVVPSRTTGPWFYRLRQLE